MPLIPVQSRVLFQPQSIQNTHHDQAWFEEEKEVLQIFRDGHDHGTVAEKMRRELAFFHRHDWRLVDQSFRSHAAGELPEAIQRIKRQDRGRIILVSLVSSLMEEKSGLK